eukprot:UN04443
MKKYRSYFVRGWRKVRRRYTICSPTPFKKKIIQKRKGEDNKKDEEKKEERNKADKIVMLWMVGVL